MIALFICHVSIPSARFLTKQNIKDINAKIFMYLSSATNKNARGYITIYIVMTNEAN